MSHLVFPMTSDMADSSGQSGAMSQCPLNLPLKLVNQMLSNNVGIECYNCSMFGEHLETPTSGIPGKAINIWTWVLREMCLN